MNDQKLRWQRSRDTRAGSEVMQRIAVPMIGGMILSALLTLVVIPVLCGLIKGWRLPATSRGELIEAEFKLPPLKEAAE